MILPFLVFIMCISVPLYCVWYCMQPMQVKCKCGKWNVVKDDGWNSWECECGNCGKVRIW